MPAPRVAILVEVGQSGDESEPENEESVGPPLGDKPLSNVTSLEGGDASTLASFLSKPVPRRKMTPFPVTASSPPVDDSEETAPPEPADVEESSHVEAVEPQASEHPIPTRPFPRRAWALGAALVIGAGVAWVVTGTGTETGAGTGAGTETGTETETGTATATATGTATETETETATETETETESLAVLPVTSPEILSQNTWARRNRAAEIRAEARHLYAANRWEDAQRELLNSLQWDPSNVDAQRNVSRTFQQLHEMERALAWARRAIATDAADARSHELLGDQLLMMGQDVEARAAYEAGLAAAPNDARLRARLRRME